MSACVPGQAHRIRYETPNGEYSRGVCRYCGYEVRHRNGAASDYDLVRGAPTGRGISGRRGGRQHDWFAPMHTVDCPHCGRNVAARGIEKHIRDVHAEVAA